MPGTPVCVFDLTGVRDHFRVPTQASTGYAGKAKPAHPVLRLLAVKGAEFDVASMTPFGQESSCVPADASTAFNGFSLLTMYFVEATDAVPAG